MFLTSLCLIAAAIPQGQTVPASETSTTGSRRALAAYPVIAPGSSGPLAAPILIAGLDFDARYVNDNMGEVDGADIPDGSLTGPDVSTSSGNVDFTGATVTALKGTFGQASNASGDKSVVSGGLGNTASGVFSTVSGGIGNEASGDFSTVSGGSDNTASGYNSTVSGGVYNNPSGAHSTISGGLVNFAAGYSSTVAGGQLNSAGGAFSFAAGRAAQAFHQGSFVWGDSSFPPPYP
ncbi:MAG: hypothetical protein HOP15_05280, partial [Planctomycetes bacterium]|nr:hypothetical protein [Planctomycetota bacterium]